MRTPGFSAEASLSNNSETYRLFRPKSSLDKDQVVPAEGGVVYMPKVSGYIGDNIDLHPPGSVGLVPVPQPVPQKWCYRIPKICIDGLGRRYVCGYFTVCR